MATWIETQQGLVNADYLLEIGKPRSVSNKYVIDLVPGVGEAKTQVFDSREVAEEAFKHYVRVLTSNCG